MEQTTAQTFLQARQKLKAAGIANSADSVAMSANGVFAVTDQTLQTPERLAAQANLEDLSQRWWHTRQGRIGTRIFSRGITGSLLYALGSIAAEKALKGYHPDIKAGAAHYDEFDNSTLSKMIRSIARGIDHSITPAIRSMFGEEAVRFRDTRHFTGQAEGVLGRSLGHEMVDVTFNFACASVGDATGRNIAKLIDPNEPISWLKGNEFDPKQFAKSQLKAAWKIFSYNQGEDWFAGLPYVYLMKAQRNGIENHTGEWGKGFKYVFDHSNTNAVKVDKNGTVTGDYYWQNALDYQLRFTYYNIATLMFREMYTSVGNRITAWRNGDKIDDGNFPTSAAEAGQFVVNVAKDSALYLARSVVKGFITMTPTVPFFWFFRVPQANSRALAINPELGPMVISPSMLKGEKGVSYLAPNFRNTPELKEVNRLTDGKTIYKLQEKNFINTEEPFKLGFQNEPSPSRPINNPYANAPAIPDADGKKDPMRADWFDPFKNENVGFFRRASNASGNAANALAKRMYSGLNEFRLGLAIDATSQQLSRATLDHVNSAVAYTPYFAAKTEFAQLDTVALDHGIDRTLSGLSHLDGKEITNGFKETIYAIKHPDESVGTSSVFASKEAQTKSSGWLPWTGQRGKDKTNRTLFAERIQQLDQSPLEDVVKYRLDHGWAKGEEKRQQRILDGIEGINQVG